MVPKEEESEVEVAKKPEPQFVHARSADEVAAVA
jgi:hypothetical protein